MFRTPPPPSTLPPPILFSFNNTPTTEIYTLSLHDALPISIEHGIVISLTRMNRIVEVDISNARVVVEPGVLNLSVTQRSEEHTSELQSHHDLVCRLLLEKKKKKKKRHQTKQKNKT